MISVIRYLDSLLTKLNYYLVITQNVLFQLVILVNIFVDYMYYTYFTLQIIFKFIHMYKQ